MYAVIKRGHGLNSVNLERIEKVKVDDYSVKIEVEAVGICGTDLHIVNDEYPHTLPIVLGHEFSGRIINVGKSVTRCTVGDRVVALTAFETCGHCSYCRRGLLMLCSERKSIGSGVHGAMAQWIAVPEKNVFQIPENISYDEAALTEPLACVVRGLMERTLIVAGEKVFISGCGTIGLLALQVARINGASVVIAGTSKDQLGFEIAKTLGAESVVNVEETDEADILRLNDGEQFDTAIECAGVEASLYTCTNLVKKQGSFIQLGLFGKKVMVDVDKLLIKEINYTNSFATTSHSWAIALELMKQGKIDFASLITNKYPMTYWKEAFEASFTKRGIKTIIHPNQFS